MDCNLRGDGYNRHSLQRQQTTDAGQTSLVLPVSKTPYIVAATLKADPPSTQKKEKTKTSKTVLKVVPATPLTEGWSLVALDLGLDTGTIAGKRMVAAVSFAARIDHELAAIRTREALVRSARSGTRLGRPTATATEVRDKVVRLRREGHSLSAITRQLNESGAPTAHGGRWHATTVRRLLVPR